MNRIAVLVATSALGAAAAAAVMAPPPGGHTPIVRAGARMVAPADAPTDADVFVPAGAPANVPAGAPANVPAGALVNVPADAPADAPADVATDLFDLATVRDVALDFGRADWERALAALPEGADLRADLSVDGTTVLGAGVRIKGNSSSNIAARKKPFNVTVDAFAPGQEISGYDTFNLNNGFVDPTLAREVLTYAALREWLPAPRATHARLHVNGAYFGLYGLVQQIEGTYLDQWFPHGGGTLFKADPPQPNRAGMPSLVWLGEDLAAYHRTYELKTGNAGDEAWAQLRELTRVLDAPLGEGGVTDAEFPAAIQRVLDVDAALWYIAAHNLFANFDSYYSGHNYFLYRPDRDGRFHLLSWDMNEAFGVFRVAGVNPDDSSAVARVDPFFMTTGQGGRPLLRRLLAVPAYRADYLAHYRALLSGAFAPDLLTAALTPMQARIGEGVRTDPNLLYGFDLFARNVWEDVRVGLGGPGPGGGGRAVPGVLKLAAARHEWLLSRADLRAPDHSLAEHARSPEVPGPAEPVRVTLRFAGSAVPSAVDLYVAADAGAPAARPMLRSGDVWTAAIDPLPIGAAVTYYARADLGTGRVAFHPAANLTQPWMYAVRGTTLPRAASSDVVINELLADNERGITDPTGQYDDWVELYNRGRVPIGLEGLYLSDDEADPQVYALPDVILAAGEHYLVWCDNDPEQGPDHADFRLGKDGEQVVLSSATETLDEITFGPQQADVSWGRTSDGADGWGPCTTPSPRRANACAGAPTGTPAASATPVPNLTADPGTATPGTTPGGSPTPDPGTATPDTTPGGTPTPGPGTSTDMPTTARPTNTPHASRTPGGTVTATPTGTPGGMRIYLPDARHRG